MTSFARCFALDLREGWRALRRGSLVAAALFCLLVLALHLQAAGRMEGGFTYGDYLASFMAGSKSYFFSYEDPFQFPIAWAACLMLVAFLTLWYPSRNLTGMGKQIMVTAGSRWSWWLAKCAWVTTCAVSFWALGCALALAWTLLQGGALSLDVSAALPEVLGFRLADVLPGAHDTAFFFFLGIPCALAALCLMQLALSFLLRPVFAYAASMSVLLLSLFYQTPWLLGNELMAARSLSLVLGGVPVLGGVAASATLAALSVVVGGLLFSGVDILDKEGYE